MRIEIPRLPPYECGPNTRVHWAVRAKVTQAAHDEVIALCREQQVVGEPFGRARVTITFTVPDKRIRDKGNLIAATKPFLDGLKMAGIIKDDSWQHIEEVYPRVQYEKGVVQTVIHVEPILRGEIRLEEGHDDTAA